MFSNKLKELRKRNGITQLELSEKLGIGQSTIGMYETGIRKPSYEVIKRIADYFNVTVDYLISDDDNLYQIEDTFINTVKKLSPKQLEEAKNFINFLLHNPSE